MFTGENPATDKAIRQWAKNGQAQKLAAGIYSGNLTDAPETIVRRNVFPIIGHLYPGILLSHRSALEYALTKTGQIFLTHGYTLTRQLPGVTLRLLEGPAALDSDPPWIGGMRVSGKARALLENMQAARQSGSDSKVLSREAIEEKLELHIRTDGEEGLNKLRDEARAIAGQLGWSSEYKKLERIISALLSTKPANLLTSPVARARALGEQYDTARLELFNTLFVALRQSVFPQYPDRNRELQPFRNFAAFEAYFSNYIEGTEFEPEEALAIISSESPLAGRHEDSHDVLGTYSLVSNREEMATLPANAEQLLRMLRYRHEVLLSARKDKMPGSFKDKLNRAGDTVFVAPELVTGTLKKGFEMHRALQDPFAKAAFMMFLISEVHPFLDGNGRIARLMMNAELVAAGQCRIIIPNVYREDYLTALRKLTRQGNPDPYIRMLQKAQAFSATLDAETQEGMMEQLRKKEAFSEPEGRQLRL